jgi:ribonuclease HII
MAVNTICGLDEAGRGALAGPLVLACVILKKEFRLKDLNSNVKIRDSKTLSASQRDNAFDLIKQISLKVDTEIVSSDEINTHGIQWANIEGFRRLIIRNTANEFIIDGNLKITNLGEKQNQTRTVVNADDHVFAVIAAGIVAKVTRDKIMNELADKFSHYGWESNVGYGTSKHIEALRILGSCEYHRSVFVQTALSR